MLSVNCYREMCVVVQVVLGVPNNALMSHTLQGCSNSALGAPVGLYGS